MSLVAEDDFSTTPTPVKRPGRVVEYVLFLIVIAMFAAAALNLLS